MEDTNRRLLYGQVALVVALEIATALATALPLNDVKLPMQHYLALHTILEFGAILAAFLVFATVWHTPTRQVSTSLLLIAATLLASGWLDFAHALSFKGMPDLLTPSSISKSLYFWLTARFLVALTLFGVSLRPRMAPPTQGLRYRILAGYTVLNFILIGAVLAFEQDLPSVYTEGLGITSTKVAIECVITGLLALAALRYFRLALKSSDEMPALIFGASAIAALGEVFFMRYTDINDAQNMLGHLFKILSYGLIYRAMFVISIRRPYDMLEEQAQLLVQANETLRIQAMALESTTATVFVTDEAGRLRWRNRASFLLMGYGRPGALDHLSLFTAPVTPDPVVANAIRETVLACGRWSGVVEIVDQHGRQLVMNRTVTSLRNSLGQLEGYVSVAENVTENRRARDRHKRVLDTAIDGFVIAGAQGVILEVNAAFENMSGYAAEELLSTSFRHMAGDLLSDARAHLDRAIGLGHDRFETRLRHKRGHDIFVAVSMTFDPEVQQFFVFVRDITDQMKSVAVRGDLERQLQQAQKMEAIGQLTGGVAHDFNNILVSVLGYSKLALDRLVPDKQSKLASYLREIIMASERARDLIAKMLVFTRTQASTNLEVVSPATAVQQVLSMVRPSIPSSIEVDVQLDSDLYIWMDAGELHQMLLNLIINARDAIDGRGVIGIRAHRVEARGCLCAVCQQRLTGAYMALEVSDTGSGITPENMPRLFDPFFTTKDVGKGTGLGLSMVQGLLIRSGGHITVESEPGRGSRFQLLFALTTPQGPALSADADVDEQHLGKGQHVAVVDDQPAVTRYLSELLQGHGYRVTPFNQPTDLLAAMEDPQQTFDLVITDQTMPAINGTELSMRVHQTRPDLPVILCTGYGSGISESDVRQARIRFQFTKPVPANALLQAIAESLDAGSKEVAR